MEGRWKEDWNKFNERGKKRKEEEALLGTQIIFNIFKMTFDGHFKWWSFIGQLYKKNTKQPSKFPIVPIPIILLKYTKMHFEERESK